LVKFARPSDTLTVFVMDIASPFDRLNQK